MFRLVVTLAALSLTPVWSGLAAAQDTPILLTPIVRLMDDVEAARAFDYPALADQGVDLEAMSRQATDWVRIRVGTPATGGGGRCVTEAEQETLTGLATAAAATSPETWRADRAEAQAMLQRWRALSAAIMAGESVDEATFGHVVTLVGQARAATDPRVRELFYRTAADQFSRNSWSDDDDSWTGPMSLGARMRLNRTIGGEGCRTDEANTSWLAADLAAHGWFRISTHGEAADGAAWLLAQHADRNPDFQEHVLAMLEPLVADGETRAMNFAYLFDRVAVNRGRPQRYGTQGRCTAPDVWSPRDLEDEAAVDALRAEIDLPPLGEYQAHMHAFCRGFTG